MASVQSHGQGPGIVPWQIPWGFRYSNKSNLVPSGSVGPPHHMSVGLYVAMRISTLFSLEREWKPATDKDIKPPLLRLCSCSFSRHPISSSYLHIYRGKKSYSSLCYRLISLINQLLLQSSSKRSFYSTHASTATVILFARHILAPQSSPSTVVSFMRDCASYNTQHFTLNSLLELWMTVGADWQ
eukprot:scaffold11865_cov76-Skeletonema_marinoi.AAC.1